MQQVETIVFGGGCFWCTEAVFKLLKGVSSVEPGYAGSSTRSDTSGQASSPQVTVGEPPTYEEVSSGRTKYVEVAEIKYDPAQVKLTDLLTVFFGSHNPTTPNRQGNDYGPQYRSVIFYTTEAQKTAIEQFVAELNNSN